MTGTDGTDGTSTESTGTGSTAAGTTAETTAAGTTAENTAAGTTGTDPLGAPGTVTPRTPVTVTSVLDAVVVHNAGAVCTRRATVDAAGAARLRVVVTDLPPTADVRSLRAYAVPEGAARVVDVRPWADAVVADEAGVSRLRRAAEEAEDRYTAARGRTTRLGEEIAAVAGLRVTLPQHRHRDGPRPAPVESMLALGDFVDARLETLHARLREAEKDTEAAAHALTLARRALDDAERSTGDSGGRTRLRTGAQLTLDHIAAGAGEFAVHVEYRVPGARWAPQYRLALDPTRTRGVLTMRACVAQRSGEDWTGVRLGLSTADLERRTALPELRALRIGRRQDEPAPAGWREPPAGLAELFGPYDAAVAKRPAPAVTTAGAAGRAGYGVAAEERTSPVPMPPPAPVMAAPAMVPPMVQPPAPMPAPAAPGAAPASRGAAGAGAPRPKPMARRAGARSAAPAPGGPPPGAAFGAAFGAAPGSPEPQAERAASAYDGAPPPEPPPAPDEDLLDYASLVLAGPDGPRRGRLRPAPADFGSAALRQEAWTVTTLALPAHAAVPRAEAGSYDYRFDTAAEVDVEGDGQWHVVPVCRVEVSLEPEFVTVPAVEEKVYGTVRVTNASRHALLAGPADVTVGGDFLMTVPLPTLAPGECRRVGLGVAESVQVSRRLRMHESTAGLRGGTTVLDHKVEIEVANLTGQAVTVEVRERVPYSHDKDVKVEEHRADPAWEVDEGPHDGRYVRGGRTWRVPLEPGGRRTLTGGYVVRIPSGKAVVGGNRRA